LLRDALVGDGPNTAELPAVEVGPTAPVGRPWVSYVGGLSTMERSRASSMSGAASWSYDRPLIGGRHDRTG
jgi:hypothetical protein